MRSGKWVQMFIRTSPLIPWGATITPIARRTCSGGVCQVGSLMNVEASPESAACRGDGQEGTHRTGDTALAADHLAHLVAGDAQVNDDVRAAATGLDVDRVGVIDQAPGDVLDESLQFD